MKRISVNGWILASAFLLACGSNGQSTADSGAEAADSNAPSVSDAPATPSKEASADDGAPGDVGANDDGAVVDRDADGDAGANRFDAGDSVASVDAAGAIDAADAAHGASCQHATDCRVFSSYCGRCDCLALGSAEPDPVCGGTQVQCLKDPCQGHTAACDKGRCVAQ